VSMLEAQLPAFAQLPKALTLLCGYSEMIGMDFFHGGIALTPHGRYELNEWLGQASSLGDSLFAFARDATGALFVCWIYETRDLEVCPVVWLDSEGVGNRVVASDPSDFAWGLADGRFNAVEDGPVRELQAWLAPQLARPAEIARPSWATDDVLEAWIAAGTAAGRVEGTETH
jgi:hypothetical protein